MSYESFKLPNPDALQSAFETQCASDPCESTVLYPVRDNILGVYWFYLRQNSRYYGVADTKLLDVDADTNALATRNNPINTLGQPMFTDENGTQYKPWQHNGMLGYQVTRNGKTHFVYFNPSSVDSEGVSNVFVYQGKHGNPELDAPIVYVEIDD